MHPLAIVLLALLPAAQASPGVPPPAGETAGSGPAHLPASRDLRLVPRDSDGFCHGRAPDGEVECWMEERLILEADGFETFTDGDLDRSLVYLNGVPVPHLALARAEGPNQLVLELRRGEDQGNRDGWAGVLGQSLARRRPLGVTLRMGNGELFRSRQPAGTLVVFRTGVMLALVAALVLVVGITLYLARFTHLLRDISSGEAPSGTYSLARTQMAVWSITAVVAFLFIWAVTGRADGISDSVLILMGIGGGTALAASVVDQNKLASARADVARAQSRLAEIAATLLRTPPPPDAAALQAEQSTLTGALDQARAALAPARSEGLLRDVLSDGTGISLHRYQMLIWTVVLWLVFWASVYHRLAMPEFSPTLLGLMGISAGTYLGFKIPE